MDKDFEALENRAADIEGRVASLELLASGLKSVPAVTPEDGELARLRLLLEESTEEKKKLAAEVKSLKVANEKQAYRIVILKASVQELLYGKKNDAGPSTS